MNKLNSPSPPAPHEHEQEESVMERELAARASALDERLKMLRMDLERIAALLMEFERAKLSLKSLKKDTPSYVQIGAGIMVNAVLQGEVVVIPVGGGYFIESKPEDAAKKIDEIIELTHQNHEKITTEVKKAEAELIDIMKKVGYY